MLRLLDTASARSPVCSRPGPRRPARGPTRAHAPTSRRRSAAPRGTRRGLARMELPRDHHVAGGVADAHGFPVDHRADTPVPHEPVPSVEVAVVPDGRALPRRRRERAFPPVHHRGIAVEPSEPEPDLLVALGQRDAPAPRRARGIHPLQGGDEPSEIPRGDDRVDVSDQGRRALHPREDVPEPRVVVGRTPLGDRNGDLQRDQRRQLRQPVELLAAGPRRSLPAREPYHPLLAEAEDRVVRPRGLDPAKRQVGPLGEPIGQQPAHEWLVDLELIPVHLRHPFDPTR